MKTKTSVINNYIRFFEKKIKASDPLRILNSLFDPNGILRISHFDFQHTNRIDISKIPTNTNRLV